MKLESINKIMKITDEGILIPDDFRYSGRYEVIPVDGTASEPKWYVIVQFEWGSFSVKFSDYSRLVCGEYMLVPDEETREKILKNAMCFVDPSVKVEKTEELKQRYLFEGKESRVFKMAVTAVSKEYPYVLELNGLKVSKLLEIQRITKYGLWLLIMTCKDLDINVVYDVEWYYENMPDPRENWFELF